MLLPHFFADVTAAVASLLCRVPHPLPHGNSVRMCRSSKLAMADVSPYLASLQHTEAALPTHALGPSHSASPDTWQSAGDAVPDDQQWRSASAAGEDLPTCCQCWYPFMQATLPCFVRGQCNVCTACRQSEQASCCVPGVICQKHVWNLSALCSKEPPVPACGCPACLLIIHMTSTWASTTHAVRAQGQGPCTVCEMATRQLL